MKKISLALMCIAALSFTACGGNSGGSASGSESSGNAKGLADGKWPAAVYDMYGITELPTKGKIVFTDFSGEDNSYQYRVDYKGVTREELVAWVNGLKSKGFRLEERDDERLNKSSSYSDLMLYQPGEGKDMRLRVGFDFNNDMEFDYWADEPNPAFTYEEGDSDEGNYIIKYNVGLSLNPINKDRGAEGSIEALGIKAEDLLGGIVRKASMSTSATGGAGIGVSFFTDHEITEADLKAIHDKLADLLAEKGVKFTNSLSGKEYTVDQLKADKVRSYNIELNDKKFFMMTRSDTQPKDFGGGISWMLTSVKK